MTDINQDLANISCYANLVCIKCGANSKQSILNIEGSIHHNTKIKCIDTKSCERRIKRKK